MTRFVQRLNSHKELPDIAFMLTENQMRKYIEDEIERRITEAFRQYDNHKRSGSNEVQAWGRTGTGG